MASQCVYMHALLHSARRAVRFPTSHPPQTTFFSTHRPFLLPTTCVLRLSFRFKDIPPKNPSPPLGLLTVRRKAGGSLRRQRRPAKLRRHAHAVPHQARTVEPGPVRSVRPAARANIGGPVGLGGRAVEGVILPREQGLGLVSVSCCVSYALSERGGVKK